MKALVVYDSFFGNTERIAKAIGEAVGPVADVEVLRAGDVKPERLAGADLLIVGSPTRGFRPTAAVSRLLGRVSTGGLEGVTVAAFDTRIAMADVDSRILKFMVKLFGYAAKPISDRLRRKGGRLVVRPEGFLVKGTEGPLQDGELERAADWARRIAAGH